MRGTHFLHRTPCCTPPCCTPPCSTAMPSPARCPALCSRAPSLTPLCTTPLLCLHLSPREPLPPCTGLHLYLNLTRGCTSSPHLLLRFPHLNSTLAIKQNELSHALAWRSKVFPHSRLPPCREAPEQPRHSSSAIFVSLRPPNRELSHGPHLLFLGSPESPSSSRAPGGSAALCQRSGHRQQAQRLPQPSPTPCTSPAPSPSPLTAPTVSIQLVPSSPALYPVHVPVERLKTNLGR